MVTDSALIEFFKLNADYFENNGIVGQVIKWLEWSLIRFFVMLADGAKTLFDAAFGVIDFTTYKPINDFIEAFKPFFIALMALSLLALAIMLIAGHEKKPKILRNIVVACLCVSCSTAVFQGLNDAVKGIKDGVDSVATAEDSFDGPYDVVEDNLTDLIYLDDIYGMKNLDLSDSKSEEYNDHRNITKENFK